MSLSRKHYFGAGPAALPPEVLAQAAEAVRAYEGHGISILELAHRSSAFTRLLEEANYLVDELCNLRGEYHILWLPGGGRMQFAMLPQNLLHKGGTGAYIDSGYWAGEALKTAALCGNTTVIASSAQHRYRQLPDVSELQYPAGTAYVHQTTNNTIFGTQFKGPLPEMPVPLVADMSSDILGLPRHYRQYDLFYAVAQKNLGPAGITLVCIRKHFLSRMAEKSLPPMYSYRAHVMAGGVLNTLPVFPIYTCLLMLRWMKEQGIENIFAANGRKAQMLYQAIDQSAHFSAPVPDDSRSLMNVVFKGTDEVAEQRFVRFAAERGIDGIEGHRSAGSFRASLYNGVSEASAALLAQAIGDFK